MELLHTTAKVFGAFAIATLLAIIITTGIDYVALTHAWTGDIRLAVIIMTVLAAHGLRGISRC